jgi:hypothetical protein
VTRPTPGDLACSAAVGAGLVCAGLVVLAGCTLALPLALLPTRAGLPVVGRPASGI